MRRLPAMLGAAAACLLFSTPGTAHHGQAGVFDASRFVELKGSVKKWSFVNPHPILLLEVTENGVTTEWDVYFGPSAVSFLRRQGFSPDTFRSGETVVIKGHPTTDMRVRGIDVWGKGTEVKRVDGSAVP